MISKELTDDFVDAFDSPTEDFRCPFAQVVADGLLPEGVDPEDPRVVRIVDACKMAARAEGTYGRWMKDFMLAGQGKEVI